jgi:hypothetical protein
MRCRLDLNTRAESAQQARPRGVLSEDVGICRRRDGGPFGANRGDDSRFKGDTNRRTGIRDGSRVRIAMSVTVEQPESERGS